MYNRKHDYQQVSLYKVIVAVIFLQNLPFPIIVIHVHLPTRLQSSNRIDKFLKRIGKDNCGASFILGTGII